MQTAPAHPFNASDAPMQKHWLWLLLALLFALRVLFALHLHVNSDEPQHLHVVWAWTQGLLPAATVVLKPHVTWRARVCGPPGVSAITSKRGAI